MHGHCNILYNNQPGLSDPLQCLPAGWAFKCNLTPISWMQKLYSTEEVRGKDNTDCVISTSQDYLLIDVCVLCFLPYSGREVKPATEFGLLASHCSGLSEWSHKQGPELKINEQLQSSQTITNLWTQWQYFHSSGKERDQTKTMCI